MISLLPENHSDSVRYFINFFDLRLEKPTFQTLQKILNKFSTIPYENISKIIKLSKTWDNDVKIRLPEEVIDGDVNLYLGGTCFSLTFFLETILLHTGFQCYPVMADMKAGHNIHCAIIVLLDGKQYIVDPGYLLNTPMEISLDKPRFYRTENTGIELFFNSQLQCCQLFIFDHEKMTWRYNFRERPCPHDEFLKHWQASFTRSSMHGICLTKVKKDGIIYIHKEFMRETTFSTKKNYKLKHNLHETINTIFGIDKEVVEQAQDALDKNLLMERKLGIFKPRTK